MNSIVVVTTWLRTPTPWTHRFLTTPMFSYPASLWFASLYLCYYYHFFLLHIIGSAQFCTFTQGTLQGDNREDNLYHAPATSVLLKLKKCWWSGSNISEPSARTSARFTSRPGWKTAHMWRWSHSPCCRDQCWAFTYQFHPFEIILWSLRFNKYAQHRPACSSALNDWSTAL